MWSLYEFLVTRWPPGPGCAEVDLSATSAPSSTRQLAVPTWSQPSRLLPSNSCVQPVPVWVRALWLKVAAPTRASAVMIADTRVMLFPPDVFKLYVPDGSLLAARMAEHVDLIPRRTGGKAAARVSVVAARDNASRDNAWL